MADNDRKGLSITEKAARNAQVVALRQQGNSWTTIAATVGLSDRHCREIFSEWRKEGKLELQELDPLDIVFDHLQRYDQQIQDFGEIAQEAKTSRNHAAAVGAVRGQAQVMAQMEQLMMDIGLLPRHLGKIQQEIEIRYVVQQLMVLLEKYVPKGKLEDAEDELLRLVRRDRGALALGPGSQN